MIKNSLVCKLRTLGETTVAFWLKRLYLVFEKWSERVRIEFWKDFDTRCRWFKLWLAGWLEVIHLWTFVYINNRLSWWARPWLVSRGQKFFEVAILKKVVYRPFWYIDIYIVFLLYIEDVYAVVGMLIMGMELYSIRETIPIIRQHISGLFLTPALTLCQHK